MKDDDVVAEVRRIRRAHAAKFNFDLDAIVKDFKSREGRDGERLGTLAPKRVSARPPANR